MNGRPHDSLNCHCVACVTFDNENELHCYDLIWPDIDEALAAERSAWESLILVCDAVFADDVGRKS